MGAWYPMANRGRMWIYLKEIGVVSRGISRSKCSSIFGSKRGPKMESRGKAMPFYWTLDLPINTGFGTQFVPLSQFGHSFFNKIK